MELSYLGSVVARVAHLVALAVAPDVDPELAAPSLASLLATVVVTLEGYADFLPTDLDLRRPSERVAVAEGKALCCPDCPVQDHVVHEGRRSEVGLGRGEALRGRQLAEGVVDRVFLGELPSLCLCGSGGRERGKACELAS